MHFELYLVRQGVIQSGDFVDALEQQLKTRPAIGALAIQTRRLSVRQVFQILGEQVDTDALFGQLAVKLGMLSESNVAELLQLQLQCTRPLKDVLIEMDLVDQAVIERMWYAFRTDASGTAAAHSIKLNRQTSSARNSADAAPVSYLVEEKSSQTTKAPRSANQPSRKTSAKSSKRPKRKTSPTKKPRKKRAAVKK